jgi:DNA polymerase III subunit epsilon
MGKAIPLSQVTFVVVDIETTGSIPEKHAILEIGAVKVRGGQIIERFETLVNPGMDIPEFIQGLTGITPQMVEHAPAIAEVMPAFWDFLGDGIFVAHYAPFDFRFLNSVTKRLLGEGLSNPQVCTCRMARKLLPGLKRKNLDSVSGYFDIVVENRHRAMGDADATALILLEFLEMLEDMEITTLSKLLDYHQKGGKRYGDLKVPYPEHRTNDFPQRPGVYLMRDEKGEILYIGKAKNLRKRVKSYFSNLYRQPHKVQELMQQVMDIETRILGSELEALLEEAYLIKQHQPYYNKQIKNFRNFPFLKVSVHEPFPQITVTMDIEDDGALYFGPYKRKRHLASMVDSLCRVFQLRNCSDTMFKRHQKLDTPCMSYEIGTCAGPCVRKITLEDYRVQVQEIVNFLEGRVSELTQRMVERRDRYAEELAFEKAKFIQDRLLELLKLQANTQYLAQAVHQNHLVILLPDREAHRTRLLYVYKGRPIYKQIFDPEYDDISCILERVAMLQQMLAANLEEKRDVIQQRELEEIRIIAHWLRHGEPDSSTRIWNLTEPYEVLTKEISAHFSMGQPVPLFADEEYYDRQANA